MRDRVIESPAGEAPQGQRSPSRRIERACLIILALLAVFYTVYFARAILLPATLALLMNLVLKPFSIRLARLGVPHVVSATLILIALGALTTVSVALLLEPGKKWIAQAPVVLNDFKDEVQSIVSPLKELQEATGEVDKATSLPGADEAVPVRIEQPRLANQMLNTTGGFLTGAMITIVLLFFLLAAGDDFLQKTVEITPTWRGKYEVVSVVREIHQKMATYLGAITLINLGLGIAIGAGLWAIGMPNPVLWGVLAALLNYIPFAGLIVGTVIVFLVAMAEFSSLSHAALAPAIYLGANGLEANFVTPAVLGRSISLNPVVILLAVFVGGWTWGIGGIFLAVPLLLILKIACDNIDELRPLGVMLAR